METAEDFTKTLPADASGLVTINLLDLDNLPVNCRRITRCIGIPPRCIPLVDEISCRVDTHTTVDFTGIRDYSYSLYDDSTPVSTTFEPNPPPE